MTVHRYLTGMTPEDQVRFALRYPFSQVPYSFLFAGGKAVRLGTFDSRDLAGAKVRQGNGLSDIQKCLTGPQYTSLFEERFPVIAVGSNCSPEQLARKYVHDGEVIPTLKAEIVDHAVVYAAHITSYGSIAATLTYVPGAKARVFINFLTGPQRDHMDQTEVLGHHYAHTDMTGFDLYLENGEKLEKASAYIAVQGVMAEAGKAISLSEIPQEGPERVAMTQRDILDHARGLLAPEQSLEDFGLAQIRDRDLRRAREDALVDRSIPARIKSHN